MQVNLIRCTKEPVKAMAEAAATCTDSEPSAEVVRKCLESGHLSIAEFVHFHFHVTGISRVCSHQLVRKRIASYAQRSQRYCTEDGFRSVMPPSISGDQDSCRLFEGFLDYSQWVYDRLRENGVKKEDARFVLPNACATEIHIAMNGHALIDFCRQRLCGRAQWEIRILAECMKDIVEKKCLLLGEYMQPKCECLGYCPEDDGCGNYKGGE